MLYSAWFFVLATLLVGYAVFDGFDLGVGAIHFSLGRTRQERERMLAAIGPAWGASEAWLLAAAGALAVAFPAVSAASPGGFGAALAIILLLLVARGVAVIVRRRTSRSSWCDACDLVFSIASFVLTLLFGVAMGNLLRGVPLDAAGALHGSAALLLNPFALLDGLLAMLVLSQHGAAWLAFRTTGDLQARARRYLHSLWGPTLAVLIAVVSASFVARPDFTANFVAAPWLLLVPLAGLGCLVLLRLEAGRRDGRAFAASAGLVATLLGSAAAGLYPRLLPALAGSSGRSLDVYNAAAPGVNLHAMLVIYLLGMALTGAYLVRVAYGWRRG